MFKGILIFFCIYFLLNRIFSQYTLNASLSQLAIFGIIVGAPGILLGYFLWLNQNEKEKMRLIFSNFITLIPFRVHEEAPSQVVNYRERIYKDYAKLLKRKQGHEDQIGLEDLKGRAPYLKKIIRDHFPQNRKANILELGCGHGAFIYFMRSMGFENVAGVDISSDQVRAAGKMGVKGVIEGDLMEFLTTQPSNSQDLVISFDVIEHFKKNELIPFIDEVHRVLRKSGKWIIHAPNGESPFFGRIRYGDFTHEQAFTQNSISQLLFSSGFSEVQCFEDTPLVHGIKSAVRRLLWIGFRLIFLLINASETGVWDRQSIFTQNLLVIAKRN